MKLNDLQNDILAKVIQGKSNKEIGKELGYSEDNIKKNITKLFKYFRVDNRIGLVREALLTMYYDFNK